MVGSVADPEEGLHAGVEEALHGHHIQLRLPILHISNSCECVRLLGSGIQLAFDVKVGRVFDRT